jgi:hypothetical protein
MIQRKAPFAKCLRPHVVGWIAQHQPRLISICTSRELSILQSPLRLVFAAHNGKSFNVLIALFIKALSTCPRFVPLVRANPHASLASPIMILKPSYDVHKSTVEVGLHEPQPVPTITSQIPRS